MNETKATTTLVTLRNDYHHTTARVRLNPLGETHLSAATIRRVKRALCGVSGCTCSGDLGTRGPQDVELVDATLPFDDGAIVVPQIYVRRDGDWLPIFTYDLRMTDTIDPHYPFSITARAALALAKGGA